jgi:hypothetical protein
VVCPIASGAKGLAASAGIAPVLLPVLVGETGTADTGAFAAGGTGSVAGAGDVAVLPELPDAVLLDEAVGVIFLAHPQTNMVNAIIENVFFIRLFLDRLNIRRLI